MADEYQDLAETHEQTRAKCARLAKENKLLRDTIAEAIKTIRNEADTLFHRANALENQGLTLILKTEPSVHSYERFLNDQNKPNGDPLPANIIH